MSEQRSSKPFRPPVPVRTEPLPLVESPWLSDVASSLESAADANAHAAIVADVWQRVADSGTPIVEELSAGAPVADAGAGDLAASAPDRDERIVTFIYRLGEDADRDDVLLLAGWLFDADNPAATRLRQLPGTDIGHLSLRMPSDWRAAYSFASVSTADDLSDPFVMRRLRAGGEPDENAQRFIPSSDGDGVRSVVELPDAPAHPWLAPRDEVDAELMRGTVVDGSGRDRRLWLHAPHREVKQILVVLDGNKWAEALPLAPTLDNLMADGLVPATATAFVESLDIAGRWVEFGCSDDFLEFLAATVLPWVRSHVDASAATARDVIVCGQSLGGLTALYAVLSRPDTFGVAIAQSPSLWWGPDAEPTEWLTARMSDGALPRLVSTHRPDAPHPSTDGPRIVLQYGAHETVIAESVGHFLPVAAAAGLTLSSQRFTGGHDDAWWWPAVGQALQHLKS